MLWPTVPDKTPLFDELGSSSGAADRTAVGLEAVSSDEGAAAGSLRQRSTEAAARHRRTNSSNFSEGFLSAGGRRTRTASRPQTAEPPSPQRAEAGGGLVTPEDPDSAAMVEKEDSWGTDWGAYLRTPPPTAPAKVCTGTCR